MAVDASVHADALRAAFEAHYLALLRLAVLLAGERATAEDLVQDVFVRSAKRIASIPEPERRSYLRAGVVNAWRNEHRHRLVERRSRARLLPVDREETPALEERDAMWAVLTQLPERQRACIVLRFYEDLSEREVARVLGCRVGTVKSQTSRALAKLREAIER